MIPYYQDSAITIYNADCNEFINLIDDYDLLVTDPPYGMNYQSNHRKVKHKKIQNDEFFPVDTIELYIEKAKYASYVFCRWNNIYSMPIPKSLLVWVKNNWTAGDLKHEHGRQWEACMFYAGVKHKFKKRIPDVIFSAKTKNELHPTQKPITLMREIIKCNEGDIVLDPFAGSGSTLIAARDCGKKAIGVELDEGYCEIIANRLSRNSLF